MKTKLFLFAIAGVAMTACTSEDVLAPDAVEGGESTAIAFAVDKANMGRAEGHASGLETVSYNFGVWAYKTDTQWTHTEGTATTGENIVMHNYLVGYCNRDGAAGATRGYYPILGQEFPAGSYYWYYEKLGSADNGFKFYNTSGTELTGAALTPYLSNNANQYLKYWDLSKTYVDFYACAPYNAATSFDATNRKMTFKAIDENDATDLMYGCVDMTSAAGASGTKVPIQFRRLSAQIRFAFYTDITSYDVEIIDLVPADKADAAVPTATGIYALAADYDGVSTYSVAANGYVTSATPVVTWTKVGSIVNDEVSYTSSTLGKSDITFGLNFWDDKTYTAAELASAKLYTDKKIYTQLRRVVPAGDVDNCGFTVNVSFKLTSKDTEEVLYVYGAKVYITPDKTNWEPNKLYTYIFKVTKNVSGTTQKPVNPDVTPGDPALKPIEFDNVTVEDIDYAEIEYPYNFN